MEEDSADKYHIPLMNNLCNDQRMAMKSNLPTIFDIEEFRRKHYDTLSSEVFMKLINLLAYKYKEIEVSGKDMNLSFDGFTNCTKKKYYPYIMDC